MAQTIGAWRQYIDTKVMTAYLVMGSWCDERGTDVDGKSLYGKFLAHEASLFDHVLMR